MAALGAISSGAPEGHSWGAASAMGAASPHEMSGESVLVGQFGHSACHGSLRTTAVTVVQWSGRALTTGLWYL